MPESTKLPWIEAGYRLFAQSGAQGLKIEPLARAVFKSKSSFYHCFADLEGFVAELLHYHRARAAALAERVAGCRSIIPEVVEVFWEAKPDLLFNRQLRIHRHLPQFRACFEAASAEVAQVMLPMWAALLGLENQHYLAQVILQLVSENFYLQLTEQEFSRAWFTGFIREIVALVEQIRRQP